jgi:hypothetical protein
LPCKACWKHAVTHDNTAIGILAGGLPSCAEGASVWPEREGSVAPRLVEQCIQREQCGTTSGGAVSGSECIAPSHLFVCTWKHLVGTVRGVAASPRWWRWLCYTIFEVRWSAVCRIQDPSECQDGCECPHCAVCTKGHRGPGGEGSIAIKLTKFVINCKLSFAASPRRKRHSVPAQASMASPNTPSVECQVRAHTEPEESSPSPVRDAQQESSQYWHSCSLLMQNAEKCIEHIITLVLCIELNCTAYMMSPRSLRVCLEPPHKHADSCMHADARAC